MESDSKEIVWEFFKKVGISKFNITSLGTYVVYQHVTIDRYVDIPTFRWIVHGNVTIAHDDRLMTSRLPQTIYGDMMIRVRAISAFNFFTKVCGKCSLQTKDIYLIENFPKCPEFIFHSGVNMHQVNMQKIYDFELDNNVTVFLSDQDHSTYEAWLFVKNRLDTIHGIIEQEEQ